MYRGNLLSFIMTVILYVFIGYLLIGFLIRIFPFIIILVIIGGIFLGIIYLINLMRVNGSRKESVKFDEYGSRKTESSVIEMKDSENKTEENK